MNRVGRSNYDASTDGRAAKGVPPCFRKRRAVARDPSAGKRDPGSFSSLANTHRRASLFVFPSRLRRSLPGESGSAPSGPRRRMRGKKRGSGNDERRQERLARRCRFTTFSRPFIPAVVKSHYALPNGGAGADRFARLRKKGAGRSAVAR